jgi:hypothetical protein
MSANRAWIGDYLLQYLKPSNYRSPENGTHNPEPEIDDHFESMTEVVENEAVDVVTRTLTPPPPARWRPPRRREASMSWTA